MNSLWHIQQPPGSSICGHCCVAMVLGVRVDKVIQEIGHKHGTKAKELVGVLRNHGVRCVGRRTAWFGGGPLPQRALLSLSDVYEKGHRRFHWVLKWGAMIHDPGAYAMHLSTNYLPYVNPKVEERNCGMVLTSHLEIF